MSNTLSQIQAKIKAPKGQVNKFGNYRFRSCEDIVEAIKPVINPMGFALTLSDELVMIGTRYYIKATASITDGTETFTATSYAREEESKKGFDASQITGAASSYARKYALNGLFAIDDTKDADATQGEHEEKKSNKLGENDFDMWQNEISNCKNEKELAVLYNGNKKTVDSHPAILAMFSKRKGEVTNKLKAS